MTTSVRRRFLFTVGANLLRSALSFTTGMLLARSLGPAQFGVMAFLLGTFLGIRQLLDMGSSAAFYTFMSQRPQSRRFITGYFSWLALQFVVPLFVVGLLFPTSWITVLWHGQPRSLVLLAFAAVFAQNTVWPVVQQAGESQRQTIRVQGTGVVIVVVHLMTILLLWSRNWLGLYAIFTALAVEYLLATVVVLSWLPLGAAAAPEEAPAEGQSVLRRYVRYCLPLLPYAWVGFAYEFADRWLLQRFGGSIQQAYYAVGAQFSAVALIATTSILNIFWKEIAEAHYRGDQTRTAFLYRRVSRVLFLVGAVIAGYLAPWARELLQLILGAAYTAGWAALAIMFLYPIHQSLGQICGTLLYATERAMLSVLVGSGFMALGIGVTYLVLAPTDAAVPGLGLASTGLAMKMVGLQLVQVNVVGYVIARIWKWPFDWVFQPVSLFGCLALGWLTRAAALQVGSGSWPLPVMMAAGGIGYVLLLALFIYSMPWLVGSTRTELVLDAGALVRKTLMRIRTA